MDPGNPLRGPRRALRRGEQALRYNLPSFPVDSVHNVARLLGQRGTPIQQVAARMEGEGVPYPADQPTRHRTLDDETLVEDDFDYDEEAYPNRGAPRSSEDDDDDDDGDNGILDDTSSRDEETAGAGNASDSDGDLVPMYGDPSLEDGDPMHDVHDDEDDDDEGEEEEEGDAEDGDDRGDGEAEDGDVDDDDDFEFASQQGDLHGADDIDALISFDPMLLGLKEINNLAHFSVSSHKPGNGVEELLHDDLDKYWQSDGPQPHLLTIHFLRRVEIRAIRFYVDYNQDESYTPTSVILSAGTGHHDLLEFATLALTTPLGWQEIDLSRVGGGADGQSLCCWIVQIKVKENHQNGKDTHIRGIKLYAIDENAPPADSALDELARIKKRTLQMQHLKADPLEKEDYLFERLITQSPDKLPGAPERSGSMATFLRDLEIR